MFVLNEKQRDILVAIDQGGSKIEVVLLLDNGELLHRVNVKESPTMTLRDFESKRWSIMANAIEKSLADIDATKDNVKSIMAGVCGADCPEDYETMSRSLSYELRISPDRVCVVNDCVAALRSVQKMQWQKQNCAVLYAGTMFNCALESESGLVHVYGRFVNGKDQGSFAIGHSAWQAIVDSYNGFQDKTLMADLALKHYDANSLPELYSDFVKGDKSFDPFMFSSIFLGAVEMEDKIACAILKDFAHRWIKYVLHGIPKVGLKDGDSIDLYLTGGVFKNCSQQWLDAMLFEVDQCGNNIDCLLAKMEPVMGDVLLLLENYNQRPINNSIICNIKQSSVYKTLLIKR